MRGLSTLILHQNHPKVDKFINSEPQLLSLQNWHHRTMHKVPSALLGIQQAVSKNGSHWLFLFWKQQTWWRKALISHSHGLKLHLYYSLARWSWENPPTSPSLTCKMENIGVHICWVSKYYIRLHRFLAHNKPSKAKDFNCYNNTRVERVLDTI